MKKQDDLSIVIPGDYPLQIKGSTHLETLKKHGQITLFDSLPKNIEDQIQRVKDADIILSAAKAGKEALLLKHFSTAKNLKIISDVNAVPPSGIEGLEVNSNGEKIKNTEVLGIGALAVGQIKAQVQHKLLKLMCESDEPVFLDFRGAYKIAQEIKK